MASCTNDSLDKLRKEDLIPIVLSLQSKLDEANNEANNIVLEEVRNLSDTITKLSSELSITKNVNTLLSSRLVTLERQCWANAQHPRLECLDIAGIPREVSREVLQEKVLNIFDKIGCMLVKKDLQKKKDWQDKKDLQKMKMEDFNLPGSGKLFINRSLCPYYKVLWSKSEKLQNLGKIHGFF